MRSATLVIGILLSGCSSVTHLEARLAELEAQLANSPPHLAIDELTAQRINVVDSDGGVRLVLHNETTRPGDWERAAVAGMVFYAPDGVEVGGLAVDKDTVYLNLDQHGTNEVVSYFTNETPAGAQRGLFVWDQYPGRPGDDQRARFRDREGREPNPREIMIPRVFSGQRLGEAIVVLGDSRGKERLRLYVDQHDRPRLEFLDERGAVTFHLPPDAEPARLPDGEIPTFNGETLLQLLALAGNDVDTFIAIVEGESGKAMPSEWRQWLADYAALNP